MSTPSMVGYYETFMDCKDCGGMNSMYIVPKFANSRCSLCGALRKTKEHNRKLLVPKEDDRNRIIFTANG